MENKNKLLTGIAAGGALLAANPALAQYSPVPEFTGKIGKTVAETRTAYPRHNPVARPGSPNVVWIVLDDTGFGTSSAFGGLIETPTMDYLASKGLRFNNFHTAAISTATRACLMTGRNHHDNHLGRFNDDKYGAPGYDTFLPMENGTVAELLRENGYATFCVGKYNLTPALDGSNAGPFNRWPTNRGFDHYFGFNPSIGADDQWHPLMYRDTHREPEDPLARPAIIRLADEAINYIADQKSAAPDQPFFLYFASCATHTPFHASKEWIDKYKGQFDDGWSEYARKTHARQLEMGIIPEGTELPEINADVEDWNALSPEERKLYARQMEVFAGFLSETDHEIGRIIDFIDRIGQLDNTLVIVALGDNGATGEGGRTGARDLAPQFEKDYIASELKLYDHYGDDRTQPFYPTGWAQACNTPFRYYKKWADYEGGTHDGMIIFYPAGIKETGGIRTQYTHAVDLLPTTLELTGSKVPKTINGYPQTPIDGVSFAYAITSPDNNVKDRKTLQYYELNASYALYQDGWKLEVPNGAVNGQRKDIYPDTEIHLYNLKEDFNESHDLAAQYPKKVKKMLKAFDKEAVKHHVYPLKSGKNADSKNYPKSNRSHYDIFTGARDYGEYPFFDGIEGKPYTITVYIDEAGEHPNGILVSQKQFALYAKDGKLIYAAGSGEKLIASRDLPAGKSLVKAKVEHKGKRSVIHLFIDDEPSGSIELSVKMNMPAKKNPVEVGRQWGVPVNEDYTSPFLFSGKIFKASIDVDTPL